MISEVSIQLGKILSIANIDEAITLALNNLRDCRYHNHIRTYPNSQPDKAHASTVVLNFQVSLDSPERSILSDPARHFQKKNNLSRIAWIFKLNCWFGEITSYQPMIHSYSDDEISIYTSNGRCCVFEPYQGFVAKLRRYEREWFLRWVDLGSPWFSTLSAAHFTASAVFLLSITYGRSPFRP